MSKTRVSCPECDAQLALDLSALAGKKVRCPKCEAIFAPHVESPDEGFEVVEPAPKRRLKGDRPRKFKAKQSGMPVGALVALIVGSGVLLAGAGVGGYFLLKKKDGAVVHKDVVPAAGIGIDIGQLAKEISAEDIHGTPFKLSDYRGKVVLLDFWGHW